MQRNGPQDVEVIFGQMLRAKPQESDPAANETDKSEKKGINPSGSRTFFIVSVRDQAYNEKHLRTALAIGGA